MIKTIGDLFEETDDWINDEEAVALQRIVELKHDYIKDFKPTRRDKQAIAKTLAVYSGCTE